MRRGPSFGQALVAAALGVASGLYIYKPLLEAPRESPPPEGGEEERQEEARPAAPPGEAPPQGGGGGECRA